MVKQRELNGSPVRALCDPLSSQQEHYVEYSRLGNVVKGQEKIVAKSKYAEDVHMNNHTVGVTCVCVCV